MNDRCADCGATAIYHKEVKMDRYDYKEAVKMDVKTWLDENDAHDLDEERLNDILAMEDRVTGNASGSYTMSAWRAEEYLCHNWEEIIEAAEEYGMVPIISDGWEYGPEWWDVAIRCRHLPHAIREVLNETDSTMLSV